MPSKIYILESTPSASEQQDSCMTLEGTHVAQLSEYMQKVSISSNPCFKHIPSSLHYEKSRMIHLEFFLAYYSLLLYNNDSGSRQVMISEGTN